jgi:hypothetical protein
MPPAPKPTKKDRTQTKYEQKEDLKMYRRIQSALAIRRDNDQCVICHFRYNRKRRREEIHHVYGRARRSGEWREHYTSLMSVCKDCHPPPIQTPGGNHDFSWVEELLREANSNPINKGFTH